MPRELTDKFDLDIRRKPRMTEEEAMRALWLSEGLNEWLNEWMEMWMEEWMDMGLWEARNAGVNAPVDMQGMAEPVMPNWAL